MLLELLGVPDLVSSTRTRFRDNGKENGSYYNNGLYRDYRVYIGDYIGVIWGIMECVCFKTSRLYDASDASLHRFVLC